MRAAGEQPRVVVPKVLVLACLLAVGARFVLRRER